jgi:hypothetical protein
LWGQSWTRIETRRSHARCYRRCFARLVVARIYRIPRDVRSDPSAACDRSRFVRSTLPDWTKRSRLGRKPMIGLREFYLPLPVVAVIIVCAVALIALFAFASLYLDLYRYANQLAKRLAHGPNQGFLEPEGSPTVLSPPDPKRASIIPTIGKAFVLDTTERMPTS